ncbi:MAG TPA: carbamoyltransferase [Terriglobia bacterium]|nr:carbamoyltransferase [Terriglobia bacterium]
MNILGISAFYHDSAACLVRDGRIVAAAQEERFSRRKHDARFPIRAVNFCLGEGKVGKNGLDVVAYYEKPLTKFVRILKSHFVSAPRNWEAFRQAIPLWLKERLWLPYVIEMELRRLGYARPGKFVYPEHHQAHQASAFFPSPFPSAAILTADGVGEFDTTTIGKGQGNGVSILWQQQFPHSLGLLYSAFTYYTGFKVNSGEYKLMGLAPYGRPTYADRIYQNLVDLRPDGSFRLNMKYFGFLHELQMTNRAFEDLFGGPPRIPESEITRREMDLARSIQVVTEEIMLRMTRAARSQTHEENLCLAGGVALNCVANGAIARSKMFRDIWIQPAAGDAGGALGAALFAWHQAEKQPRTCEAGSDTMCGSYLGPSFSDEEAQKFLAANGYPYRILAGEARAEEIAALLAQGRVVGLFQGAMEYGPRALGNRSILADARNSRMQSHLNLATKFRESFRPFAPAVLEERAAEWFELDAPSPYMLMVASLRKDKRQPHQDDEAMLPLAQWVNQVRSVAPAITHVDYSARIQTVARQTNPDFHGILSAFERMTGCPLLVNTSFNVRSEPIVCTPANAYQCFMRTGIDVLVLNKFLLHKCEQPAWEEAVDWRQEFGLD